MSIESKEQFNEPSPDKDNAKKEQRKDSLLGKEGNSESLRRESQRIAGKRKKVELPEVDEPDTGQEKLEKIKKYSKDLKDAEQTIEKLKPQDIIIKGDKK